MAKYFNINNSSVADGDSFAIDTNVLYWFFYAPNTPYNYDETKVKIYSPFMENIVNNCKIYITSNVLLELFKIIEKNEYSLYLSINDLKETDFSLKEYRKHQKERECVKDTIKLVYEQLCAVATIVYDCNNDKISNNFISDFTIHKADYVDYTLVKCCEQKHINNILTDDFDYITIHNSLNIYSGNPHFFR